MPILYFWVRDTYLENTADKPKAVELEQNGSWLADADEKGESLWAFTRNSHGEYVLVLHYRIRAIRHVGDEGEYGEYRLIPEPGTTIWFDPENGDSVENVIRRLSIAPNSGVLGRSFQGRGAIRRITRMDSRQLLDFSRKTTRRAQPRVPEAKLRHGAAVIQWEDADYWMDFLPLHFFSDGPPVLASHILRQGNETSAAHCMVTASGSEVRLDYSHAAVRAINQQLENDIGVARMRFGSAARDDIPVVDWYDSESGTWTQKGVFSWPTIEALADYKLPNVRTAKRRQASIKERPGQRTFRSKLSSAYGEICMLTRCRVEEALDAAHIRSLRRPRVRSPAERIDFAKGPPLSFRQRFTRVRANLADCLFRNRGRSARLRRSSRDAQPD